VILLFYVLIAEKKKDGNKKEEMQTGEYTFKEIIYGF
jgi:hypothetical protein